MKKVVVRIAEGLGNQLFMYANAYTLSKKINYTLFTDSTSGYFKKKNQTRAYELSKLNISASEIDNTFKYDNYLLDIKRKFYKKLDSFFYKKNFLIENIDRNKITEYNNYSNNNFSNLLRIEGYIYVETESQKSILLGKKGKKIRDLSKKSRLLIEEMYNKQVYINFTIKVLKWRNDQNFIHSKY